MIRCGGRKSTSIIELLVKQPTSSRPGIGGTSARPPTLINIFSASRTSSRTRIELRANEPGMPPINCASLEASQRPFDAIARQARLVILSCLYRLHIDGNLTGNFHAEVGRATCHVRSVGTRNQGLCRRAPGVDASPAKKLALDYSDGLSCVGQTMSKCT